MLSRIPNHYLPQPTMFADVETGCKQARDYNKTCQQSIKPLTTGLNYTDICRLLSWDPRDH